MTETNWLREIERLAKRLAELEANRSLLEAELTVAVRKWSETQKVPNTFPSIPLAPVPQQYPNYYWWPPQIWCQMSGSANGTLHNRIAESDKEGDDAQG